MEESLDFVITVLSKHASILTYPTGDKFLKVSDGEHTRTYKIVNKIPPGYHVWPIGDSMGVKGYVPLCTPCEDDPMHVDGDRLLTLSLPENTRNLLVNVANVGAWSLEDAKRIRDNGDQEKLGRYGVTIEDLDDVIKIFERISEPVNNL